MRNKLILLAVLLILIGVIGYVFTYDSSHTTKAINENKTIDLVNIDTISINTTSVDTEIIAAKEQDKITIELTGNTSDKYAQQLSIDNKNRHVNIQVKEEIKNKWFQFNISFKPETLTLKVYVPESFNKSLEFDTVSGDLLIENVIVNDLTINATSADIDGHNIQAKLTTIRTVSGDVDIENISGANDIESTSGDIDLSVTDLINPIDIETTSGDIEIETKNEPTDVNIKINTVSGDIDILDEYNTSIRIGEGSTLVNINTTSGDVSIDSM